MTTTQYDVTARKHGQLREQVRTDEFVVLLVDGEVAQSGGRGADDAVRLDVEQLDEDRQRLLLPHLCADRFRRLEKTNRKITIMHRFEKDGI